MKDNTVSFDFLFHNNDSTEGDWQSESENIQRQIWNK